MESEVLLNGTVGGLHGWDVNRWILFCPLFHSVITYWLVNVKSYSLVHYILLWVLAGLNWERNLSFWCFPMKNAFRLFSYPISLASTEGTCSGSWYSGWSIPVSSILVLVTLSLHRILSFFTEMFKHFVFGWVVMLLCAQRYFLHNIQYWSHSI